MTGYRDIYYCPMNQANVEGIKPDKDHGTLIVTKDKNLLPDSDRLILEDTQGFRYMRDRRVMTITDIMVFERI